jgi:ABC-type antimicrobial peptide transport system permease subunit
LYAPTAQSANRASHLMVRTDGDIGGVAASIRAAVKEVDPAGSFGEAVTMRTVVDDESAPWRFLMRVFVAFATMAAALAVIGLAAVVTLAVVARRRELAIRAALGADAWRLRWLVLREALGLTGLGILVGIAGAMALGRGVAPVVIGIRPDDPWTLATIAAAAGLAGLSAAWWPARQAARSDPMAALRAD